MKPPMNNIVYVKGGDKDEWGMDSKQGTPIPCGRIKQLSTTTTDNKGMRISQLYEFSVGPDAAIKIGDDITLDGIELTVTEKHPRRTWSGKKIMYVVIRCGR